MLKMTEMTRYFPSQRTFFICFVCVLAVVIICYQWILPKSGPPEHLDTTLHALNILNAVESNRSWILTFLNGSLVSSSYMHHVRKRVGAVEDVYNVSRIKSSVSLQSDINSEPAAGKVLRSVNHMHMHDSLLNQDLPKWSYVNRGSTLNQLSVESQLTVRKNITEDIFMLGTDNNQVMSAQQTIRDLNKKSSASGLVNVVAMSLYGSELRYTAGVIRNAYLARQNFPGWQLWVYVESPSSSKYPAVPEDVISRLVGVGAEVHYISPDDDFIPPMMWRFLVADDAGVDWFIVRDADSRLTPRDAAAVATWMRSGRAFHCIRDHPSHAAYAVSGGLWGGRAPVLRLALRRSWASMMRGVAAGYLNDMNFLNGVIWPRVERLAYCVDSVSCDRWKNAFPFPVARHGYEHVGQVYDEHDRPRKDDVQILKHTLENRNCIPVSEPL